MSFSKRIIEFTLNYGQGQNGDEPGTDVTLRGHRAQVSLSLDGGTSQPAAYVRIFGLPLEMMNRLTVIGANMQERRDNKLMIAAGSEDGPMSVVFQGVINEASADLNQAPDVALSIFAMPQIIAALKPVNARSYVGAVDAAKVMEDLAGEIGAVFENNGVSVILQNPYFPGTAWRQVERCAAAAQINYSLDRGVLSIWPRAGSRSSQPVIRVAKETGMVGYPTFNSQGISVRSVFNADVVLGSKIEVETTLTPAEGRWIVYAIYHTLEAELPNGQWFTEMLCRRDWTNE